MCESAKNVNGRSKTSRRCDFGLFRHRTDELGSACCELKCISTAERCRMRSAM